MRALARPLGVPRGKGGAVDAEADQTSEGNGPISDELLIERTRLHWALTIVVGIPISCISFGLLMLLAVPLAHVIAGRHTDVSFSVSFSLNAVLASTSVVSGAGFALQSRRARYHKDRARELEGKVRPHDGGTSQQRSTEAR
jgi:hypothetical protein